jgi:ankyrin repeat protein
MRLTLPLLTIAAGVVIALSQGTFAQSPAPLDAAQGRRVDFARDVQPLLRTNCYGCHSASLASGNFRLDRRRDSMPNRVGANGARIVPGNSETSRLYQRVSGAQAGLQMPPTGALQPEEIRTIKLWIDQGADWPDELAGETPSPPQDPLATQMLDAISRGDRAGVARLLTQSPQAAAARGFGGITPLMYAALYGDAASARLLLDAGADPNARNDAGATALMWAVDDLETTRMLLERRADPNARSMDGRSALVLAAGRNGAGDVVKVLLDFGATVDSQPVLTPAADAGDPAIIRLLLERGAARGPMPADLAMRSGCIDCLELLLPIANRPALTRALESAARYGDSAGMRMLLDRGAEPTVDALRMAAASEGVPLDGVMALLDRGVRDGQALDMAVRHGDTSVAAALRKAGARETSSPAPVLKRPAAARSARDAIAVSLPLLQHADTVFLKTAGCISCHNNSLFSMTAAAARQKGFRVDEAEVREQMTRTRAYLESWRERELQDIAIPGRIDTTAYILVGLAAAAYPPDPATDALARYVKRRQLADGSWRVASHRPPIESSDVAVTALSVRSLHAYAPAPLKAAYARAIQRGAAWLTHATPKSNEDHAYLVLGLTWAGASRAAIRKAANALIAQQRADGGWSQIATLPSDAYATGQALTALAQSGVVKPTDPAYEKGVRFLLGSQLEDGSWYVRSRAIPIQPYFDSEFPHGKDQFLSAAATNWATMALTWAVR